MIESLVMGQVVAQAVGQEGARLVEGHALDAGVQHDVIVVLVREPAAEQPVLEFLEEAEADHGDLAVHEVAVDIEGGLDAV